MVPWWKAINMLITLHTSQSRCPAKLDECVDSYSAVTEWFWITDRNGWINGFSLLTRLVKWMSAKLTTILSEEENGHDRTLQPPKHLPDPLTSATQSPHTVLLSLFTFTFHFFVPPFSQTTHLLCLQGSLTDWGPQQLSSLSHRTVLSYLSCRTVLCRQVRKVGFLGNSSVRSWCCRCTTCREGGLQVWWDQSCGGSVAPPIGEGLWTPCSKWHKFLRTS